MFKQLIDKIERAVLCLVAERFAYHDALEHSSLPVYMPSDSDRPIDPDQVEFLIEEIRQDPRIADDWSRELISLYRFQQALIDQWERGG